MGHIDPSVDLRSKMHGYFFNDISVGDESAAKDIIE
jgi:hypothetical protein